MDLQYLAARCNKGTAAVAAYMNDHHRYMKVNFLADAHADLIRWQKDLDAANGWLGCHLCLQFCCLWIECCDKRRGCQFQPQDGLDDHGRDSLASSRLGSHFMPFQFTWYFVFVIALH